ncbi:MAG: hypothetical protein ACXW4B_06295 [Micavibrio sp.]
MAQTAMMRDSAVNTEYTIYTFQREAGVKSQARWHKQDTLCDMNLALEKAGSLFDSGDFCKVEIKQKYTDPKNQRVIDTTVKVLERKTGKFFGAGLMALMAVLGGGLAFALSFILT